MWPFKKNQYDEETHRPWMNHLTIVILSIFDSSSGNTLGEDRPPRKCVLEGHGQFPHPASQNNLQSTTRVLLLWSVSTHCPPNSSPTGLLPGFLCRPSLFLFQGLKCGFLTFSFGCVLAHRGLSPDVSTLERTSLALMVTGFTVASSTGRDFQPQYLILFA